MIQIMNKIILRRKKKINTLGTPTKKGFQYDNEYLKKQIMEASKVPHRYFNDFDNYDNDWWNKSKRISKFC